MAHLKANAQQPIPLIIYMAPVSFVARRVADDTVMQSWTPGACEARRRYRITAIKAFAHRLQAQSDGLQVSLMCRRRRITYGQLCTCLRLHARKMPP